MGVLSNAGFSRRLLRVGQGLRASSLDTSRLFVFYQRRNVQGWGLERGTRLDILFALASFVHLGQVFDITRGFMDTGSQ